MASLPRLDIGDHGDRSSPTLLLVHGALDSGASFAPLIERLAGSYHVLAPDLRGHGKSDRADDYRVIDHAEDMVALLDRAGSGRAVVVGHSLGGLIGLRLAAARPDLTVALVLIDPPLLVTEGAAWPGHFMFGFFRSVADAMGQADGDAARLAPLLAALAMPRPRADRPRLDRLVAAGKLARTIRAAGGDAPPGLDMLIDGRAPPFGAMLTTRQLAAFAEELAQVDPAVPRAIAGGALNDGFDHRASLAGVRCPLVYLEADRDVSGILAPGDIDDVIAAAPATIDHRLVDGAGHYVHQDRPELITGIVMGFLEGEV